MAADDPALGKEICGIPVVCRPNEIIERFPDRDTKIIFCLYKPEAMRERVSLLRDYRIPAERWATFVHPSSYVAATASIGPGTAILSHCAIQHAAHVGNCSIVNSSVVIEHEAVVRDSTFLAAGCCIGARVDIGTGTFIGLRTAIREDVRVGQFAFVGMSANVLSDVPDGGLAFGNPARLRQCLS